MDFGSLVVLALIVGGIEPRLDVECPFLGITDLVTRVRFELGQLAIAIAVG